MESTFTLCIRKGNVVTWKSDLPILYKHKSIGFEEFEDTTQHDARYEDKGEHRKHAVEDRRWYSAGKELDVFQEIRVRIAAGERFELSREIIIQTSKELDQAVKDLAQPRNSASGSI